MCSEELTEEVAAIVLGRIPTVAKGDKRLDH
jgi:hypothetical protein